MKSMLIVLVLALCVGAVAQTHQINNVWLNAPATVPPCPVAYTTNLYRSTTSGGQTTPIKTGITGTTYIDTTPLDGNTYWEKVSNVCAWPSGAKEGGLSAEVMVVIPPAGTPAPGIPTGLTATPTTLGAQLNWNVVPNVKEYHVFASTPGRQTWHYTATATKPNFLDRSVAGSQTAKWFVTSSGAQGESNPSLVATVTSK